MFLSYGGVMKDIKILINKKNIDLQITRVAREIEKDYEGQEIVIMCILKGSVYFAIDLSRKINKCDVILDFMKVNSYSGTKSTGKIDFTLDASQDLHNKNVIIVEDIIDTGISLDYLSTHLINERDVKSLKICVLLDKLERRVKDVNVDYC